MLRFIAFPGTMLLAATVLAGCASRSALRMENQLVCESGTQVLVVRNDAGLDVELHQYAGAGNRRVLAVLPPGRHELEIPNESRYSYAAQTIGSRTTLAATSRPRVRDRAVLIDRECRS